jgi:hypothetical protein
VPSDGVPSWLPALFIVFIVIFVIALIGSVGMAIWKATVLRQGGLNPFVAQEQLEARLNQNLRSGPPVAARVPEKSQAPEKSKEERLSEVMDLHERGLISDAELAEARAKIISG